MGKDTKKSWGIPILISTTILFIIGAIASYIIFLSTLLNLPRNPNGSIISEGIIDLNILYYIAPAPILTAISFAIVSIYNIYAKPTETQTVHMVQKINATAFIGTVLIFVVDIHSYNTIVNTVNQIITTQN